MNTRESKKPKQNRRGNCRVLVRQKARSPMRRLEVQLAKAIRKAKRLTVYFAELNRAYCEVRQRLQRLGEHPGVVPRRSFE